MVVGKEGRGGGYRQESDQCYVVGNCCLWWQHVHVKVKSCWWGGGRGQTGPGLLVSGVLDRQAGALIKTALKNSFLLKMVDIFEKLLSMIMT